MAKQPTKDYSINKNIIKLEDNTINFRDDGGVIADVVSNGVIFQIRTYKKRDDDRKEGSKRDI